MSANVAAAESAYRMKRPSDDQSVGNFVLSDFNNSSAFPAPLEVFQYRSNGPDWLDENTIRLLSGDQTGLPSTVGSKVNLELVCLARSVTQISLPADRSARTTATFFSSGESTGESKVSGVPTNPSCFPVRSTQVS